MSEQTDSELAYSLEGALEPLGAQWAEVEAVVPREDHATRILKAFGEQLAEIERLVRLEVAENERLRSLNTEMREKLEKVVEWLDRLRAQSERQSEQNKTRFPAFSEACAADAANYRKTADDIRAILAKTETDP